MTETIDQKMYEIAKYLGDLNVHDKVKKFGAGEKGYATVQKIRSGISIRVHHLKYEPNNDRLIIDLMITENAGNKFQSIADTSVAIFKEFFHRMIVFELWTHPINKREGKRYLFDIKEKTLEDIHKILHDIRDSFSKL